MKYSAKGIARLGVCLAAAMILSYVELLLPPIMTAVPGIKLGLANIAVIYILYSDGARSAALVLLSRVLLSALLFGTVMTLAYSAAGALLSFVGMLLLKKTGVFSTVGVSIGGGVLHNAGQIIAAIFLLGTREIGYYMIPLSISGIVAGVFVGIASSVLIKRVKIK